jgi:hypothetical protein
MAMALSYLLGRKALERQLAQPRAGNGHEVRVPRRKAVRIVAKPAGESDAPMRRVRIDLMTLFWYGTMVGFMAAALIPPFPESRSSKNQV